MASIMDPGAPPRLERKADTSKIATAPLWWDGRSPPAETCTAPPARVDVLIVGAGYTGLSAARETAAAGRSTLVLDALAIGGGCSGRNGGQVAYSIKPSFASLRARHGADRAFRIRAEGVAALHHLRSLCDTEGLDAGWRSAGVFVGAHTSRHYGELEREAEQQTPGLEQRITLVPKAAQHAEIASDFYHGGSVYEDEGSVDPARLLAAVYRRAVSQGAEVIGHCAVESIERSGDRFEVKTALGPVHALQVLLATNGYTGNLSPWHRRRMIPIGSYQIATEPLGPERVRALIPRGRAISDTRRVVVYYRPSADGERIVFGGRSALYETNALACVPRLRSMLTQVFPQLKTASITHAWAGWVGYTFDKLPHLGRHDGISYCMGYCGQGVPLAPYFGMRIGQQMVGNPNGRTALDGLPFPSRPFYRGTPWFLAPTIFSYRWLDRLGL
jgi:glycine/D-amino acid oxidase-like deaminating enzyme